MKMRLEGEAFKPFFQFNAEKLKKLFTFALFCDKIVVKIKMCRFMHKLKG